MKLTSEVIKYLNNENTFILGVKILCNDNNLKFSLNGNVIGTCFNIHSSTNINHDIIYRCLAIVSFRKYRVCLRSDIKLVYLFFYKGDEDEDWIKKRC